ncbi:MAG: helix-turn-helix domain-containing protein, partial [Gammaproteobacteria bacterium]
GQVGSMLELLQGRLSNEVMAVVTDRETGLFPRPGEISFDCSCPDWATMCKHVAAVLYGVGNRLDGRPGLLFTLRGVDADELIAEELALPAASGTDAPTLSEDHIGSIFGIELDAPVSPAPSPGKPPPRLRPTGKSVARLRRQSGDTVAEFARRLGVSSSTVYRWESTAGRLKLKPRILEALAGLSRKA